MRIETRYHLEHPRDEVNAWLERPGALTRLTPPGLATAEDAAEGGTRQGRLVGVRLGPTLLPQPLRPRWLLRHADATAPFDFADQQVRGPWRTWRHEHAVEQSRSGAAVHDRLEVELPRRLERWEPRVGELVRGVLHFRARQLREDLAFHAARAGRRPLTVAIAGSSGLIGSQLAALLRTGGHTVRPLVRRAAAAPGEISWDPQGGRLDPADLEGVDVVVNLGGRSIATRWTAPARAEIRASRLAGTTLLARTLAGMADGPTALVQASAIGYYGPRRPGRSWSRTPARGRGSSPRWCATGRPRRPRRARQDCGWRCSARDWCSATAADRCCRSCRCSSREWAVGSPRGTRPSPGSRSTTWSGPTPT